MLSDRCPVLSCPVLPACNIAALKITHPHGELDPIQYMVPLAHSSSQPKRHVDRFSRFCRAHDRDRETDRQTDHVASVTVGRIYTYAVLRRGLIILNMHNSIPPQARSFRGNPPPRDGCGFRSGRRTGCWAECSDAAE